MKVTLNQETGKVEFWLKNNEKYDMEEHLDAVLEFVSEQARLWFALSKRLERLESTVKNRKYKGRGRLYGNNRRSNFKRHS